MDEFDSVGSAVNHRVIDHDRGLSRWIRAQYFLYRGDRTLAHGAIFLCTCILFISSDLLLLSSFRCPQESGHKAKTLADTHSPPRPCENRWNSIVVTRAGRYILPSRVVRTWPRVSTRVSPNVMLWGDSGCRICISRGIAVLIISRYYLCHDAPLHRFETEILI